MASLTLPVRWYSNETQHGELELELDRTAFMIVDSDCGAEIGMWKMGLRRHWLRHGQQA